MQKDSSGKLLFYAAKINNIEVYQIDLAELKVEKIKEFTEIFSNEKIELYSAIFDPINHLFYITAENVMYTLAN